MLHWFHALPNIYVFALIVILVGVPMILAPHVVGWLTGRPADSDLAAGAWEATKLIVASAGAVLAFSLVQVQGNLRNASELVVKEAGVLTSVDRRLARFEGLSAEAARPLLQGYATSILRDDWPAMTQESAQRADATDAAFVVLVKAVRALSPANQHQAAVFAELPSLLDAIYDAREARLAAAGWSLPGLFWWTVLALMALLICLVSMMERTAERTLAMTGIAISLSLMLALVIVIDGPFDGETAVPPTPIERSLAGMGGYR